MVWRRFCKKSSRAIGTAPERSVGVLLMGESSSTMVTTWRLARSRMTIYGCRTAIGSARLTRSGAAIAPRPACRAAGVGVSIT
jgi:hypothetical protein